MKAVKGCATSSPDPNLRAVYIAVSLTDFSTRLNRLGSLTSGAKDLKKTLVTNFADSNRWNRRSPRAYTVGQEIEPTFATMQTVKVTVNMITVSSDDVTGAINMTSKEAGSTTFSVRKYARLTPEPGFGAVFGFIERPIYGTSINASGQMVVAKKSTENTTLAPTATVNFVCRCSLGLISPMFQLGASITKDLPALLVGGGIRLFGLGKGDVALGGGAMFGWYKDLKTLTVGSPIKGTTDIDNDLTYISAPKTSGYLTIQYKFSL